MVGRRLAVWLVCVVVFATLAAGTASTTVLHVQDARTDATVGVHQVDDGDRFTVHYIHSFDKTPINEVYEVRGTRIVQIREEFQYHAIGLEYTQRNQYRRGNFTVLEMEREFESFNVRIAKYTNQSLWIDDREIPFHTYAKRWSTLRFSVERVSYLEYLSLRLGAQL